MVPQPAHDDDLHAEDDSRARQDARAAEGDDVEQIELSEEAARFVEDLKGELDEAISARQRALADFANYQRRAVENESRARKTGIAQVVRSIIPVLDHFDLALGQQGLNAAAEKILDGVKIVRDELRKALEQQGVTTITPRRGEEFNPLQHEAMMNQPADDVAPGSVLSVLQPGYALGEMTLRPAKVVVAAGGESELENEVPE